MTEEDEPSSDGSTYLEQAETNITNNNFVAALALLRSAQPFIKQNNIPLMPSSTTSANLVYLQLQAICRIEIAHASAASSSNDAWWHVFGLENQDPTSNSSSKIENIKNVKRQYKRLAILIHPDKCNLPCAQDTFKKLKQGLDVLIESIESSETAKKRVKRQRENNKNYHNDDDGEEEEEESFLEEEETEEEFAWWTEWDNPYTDNQLRKPQQSKENFPTEEENKEEEEIKKDLENLSSLDCEMLAQEIRSRQDAMLSRLPPGRTMQEMKSALTRARTVFIEKSEKKKEEQEDNEGVGGGGFLL